MYCEMGEAIAKLMSPVAELRACRLFLLYDQSFEGRCVLALKNHRCEADELSAEERGAFMRDLSDAAAALRAAFKPDKINYAIFGDFVPHFHVHLVPKYKDGPLWGSPYCSEKVPEKRLSEADYRKRAAAIREALEKIGKEG
jgi:diadenosine tetraphosphate (Ap4A) HIT family hydrolase